MKTAKLEEFKKSKKPWEVEGVEWKEVRLEDIVKDVKSGFALSKQKRVNVNKDT